MVATEFMKLHHQQDASKFFLTTTTSRKMTPEKDITALNNYNPSFRVYYGGSSVAAVPFTWESAPGTPKHKLLCSDNENCNPTPPLTPPPSFYSSDADAACATKYSHSSSAGAKNILGSLLASSSSSSSTSSSSGDANVYNRRRKKKRPRLISRWFSCSVSGGLVIN
ncbi:hypothetical protein LINGRAPRIM_LOCUS2813 [Linum grandiflorum]